ncbi:MAG TPA: hypothetical protein VK817_24080, partial [Trebonia sp.]|nr:hypothetical protein [Trebonia sp.]
NLLTFLANRLNMSFTNLGCQNFGLTNPVTVTLNGAGVAVAATFNTARQKAAGSGSSSGNSSSSGNWWQGLNGHRKGRGHHQLMNPSGM